MLGCDDYRNTRLLLERILRGKCEVTLCASEAEVLELADGHDVYLIDINLNGENSGKRIMEQLRKDERNQHSRYVAFTAHNLPGAREKFLQDGFDDFLPKPFTIEQLMECIDNVKPSD